MFAEPCYDITPHRDDNKPKIRKKYSKDEVEIIIRFIEAFNKGGQGGPRDIVDAAIIQYDRLKERVIDAEDKYNG